MSADNRICIMFDYPCRQWAVWNGSASMEYHEPSPYCHHFWTRKEALEYADKEQRENYYEYGGGDVTVEEQEQALREHIKFLRERLKTLIATGAQYPNPDTRHE